MYCKHSSANIELEKRVPILAIVLDIHEHKAIIKQNEHIKKQFCAHAFVLTHSSDRRTSQFFNVFILLNNCSILMFIEHYCQDRHCLLELDIS